MNPLRQSIHTFVTALVFALGPIAGMVLLPNTWWGWLIKALLALLVVGIAINFMRPSPMREFVYGKAAPGFVLIMPLFAATIGLTRGFWKTSATFLFLFFSASCFLMIYQNAKTRMAPAATEDSSRV
ncbi:hypothetical protein [Pseudomonas luteola]|uniref:hypothetical protein n=1 Tax=Pseudomonas luteola TaxID=47886 RepID=UPI00289740B3|nr:hypothetical protein [Pseudomonas luteola]